MGFQLLCYLNRVEYADFTLTVPAISHSRFTPFALPIQPPFRFPHPNHPPSRSHNCRTGHFSLLVFYFRPLENDGPRVIDDTVFDFFKNFFSISLFLFFPYIFRVFFHLFSRFTLRSRLDFIPRFINYRSDSFPQLPQTPFRSHVDGLL